MILLVKFSQKSLCGAHSNFIIVTQEKTYLWQLEKESIFLHKIRKTYFEKLYFNEA